jgi:PAS domain S-box-containing protein
MTKHLPRHGRHGRLEGEDLFRKLFEQCPVGLSVLGPDERILKANPSMCAMLGYSEGRLTGSVLLDLIHSEDVKGAEQRIRRLRGGEVGTLKFVSRFLRKDGTWFWASLTAAMVRDGEGEAPRAVAVMEDVSSRKRTEANLIRSNADLELYASIASHDLQEPVRKVITYGEMLAKMSGGLPAEGRVALAKSQRAALRMKDLIEDLLEYARLNAAGRALAPVDLNLVLREVLSDLELSIAERSGRVELGELPIVEADALQMRLLFQNLISNAVKFTEPGQPPDIAVTAELLGGTRVRLEVKDRGIGFDEKFLDRIFRPFQRLCDQNIYEGSGIGLAICKKVVQRHGGSITAVSAPGKGACFIVVLPVGGRTK